MLKTILPGFCLFILQYGATAQTIIKGNDAHIHYMGRVQTVNDQTQLQWSGTSASLNFYSTGVTATLDDEPGGNFFNVIVDGKVTRIIHLEKGKKDYILAERLPAANHTVELFKRTEAENGKTLLSQFSLSDGRVLPASPAKKRKIEFYGNSITCGLAMADTVKGRNGDENNYLAYGALTARHFNAEYSCIARSGIGITVSWFPVIMPELYDRLDETEPNSKWDFSKYTPDVVVTNLGQNDSWIVKQPTNDQYKARFGAAGASEDLIVKAYVSFIKTIRGKYPKAKIICALGSMDATKEGSPWPGYIEKAVKQVNDKDMYSLIVPYNPAANPFAHPSVAEHQKMADQLIAFIDKNIKW
jgi:hypothetical protein